MEKLTKKYLTERRRKREMEIDGRVDKYLGGVDMKNVDMTETTNNNDNVNRDISFIRSRLSSAKSPVDAAILGCCLSLIGSSSFVDDEGLRNQIRSTVRVLVSKL
ncbi:MAG: hypothetical protein WCJ37_02705 [Syntrophus sp. (in: bacteria)]